MESASAVGCPPDYAAATALGVAAGVIGASFDLQVKRRFLVPSSLWVCVVAPPGSGKSPSVAPVLEPIYDEQSRRAVASGADAYVEDATTEKLVRMLSAQPRGMLMVWDEMAGWLTSFNQYKAKGAGNDRARYLSIWDGRSVKVDRVGPDTPPLYVRRPRLSVVGGIQPEVLDGLREGPADGLFDRMLFSYPPDPGLAVETFEEVEDAPVDEWRLALTRLWQRKMKEADGDDPRPNVIALTGDGQAVWKDWTQVLHDRDAEENAPPYFRQLAAKMQGYAARLALVCHLIHEAYSDAVRDFGVSGDGMMRGVTLAEYFLAHAGRVRQAAGRDTRLAKAKAVARWAVGAGRTTFTRSDAWASLRNNTAFAGPEDLDEPLRRLTLHRYTRWAGVTQSGPGRPPQGGGHYELNPALLQGQAAERTV